MMRKEKNILVIIDVQEGFVKPCSKDYEHNITNLLEAGIFDGVVSTIYKNQPNSMFCRLTDWDDLCDKESQQLLPIVKKHSDVIIEKTLYTGINTSLMQEITALNNGIYPTKLFMVGIDTDACVLKSALDLFEYSVTPIILEPFCESSGGVEMHEAGMKILERLLGERQIIWTDNLEEIKSKVQGYTSSGLDLF